MADKLVHVRASGFTVLPNTPARDPRLSLSAKGLFWVMSSLPDDWQFTIHGLAMVAGNGHGTGRDAISAGLKMLEDAGYLLREQRHDENGKFEGNTYVLYDESLSPFTGFPSTGFPSTENPSPDPTKYRVTNITPKAPKGGEGRGRKSPRANPDWKPERFSRLWEAYPHDKRGNKQKAMDMWDRLRADDDLLDHISRQLRRLMASERWKEGVGVPHVSTFLNPASARWDDADNLDGGGTGAQNGTWDSQEAYGWQ